MSAALPALCVLGIGAWASGMPDWSSLSAVARGEAEPSPDAPRKPAPELLAPNERRRAPDTVLLALEAGLAACRAADADPATLSSIFASMHGELSITDAMCRTASTAISAYRATMAQGLIEAAMQLAAGEDAVLLVAYDGTSIGPLSAVSPSAGLLGIALVLGRADAAHPALRLSLTDAAPIPTTTALQMHLGDNALAPALPLIELLAREHGSCELEAGHDASLRLEWTA